MKMRSRTGRSGSIAMGICGLCLLLGVHAATLPGPTDEWDDAKVVGPGDEGIEHPGDWSRWARHDPSSTAQIDYSAWATFVADFGDGDGGRGALDYLRLTRRGHGFLHAFVTELQALPVSQLSRDEQLAYWMNLHNAQAVLQTTLNFPIKDESARELVLGKPWSTQSLTVEGVRLSLDDIERRILFRHWPDPLVIYGLYLPATGAPRLAPRALVGRDIRAQLEARARLHLRSGHAFELSGSSLDVSALYHWDRALFADDAALIAHLRRYAAPADAQRLATVDTVRASWLNWRLNTFNSGYDVNADRSGGGGAS